MRPLLLMLLTTPALAEDVGEDLPTMAKKYGWETVAIVTRSAYQGDATRGDTHELLEQLGLDRVRFPVASPVKTIGTALTDCGWNDGISCRLDLAAGAPTQHQLRVACHRGEEPLPVDLSLVTAVDPRPDTPGEAWVSDVAACWAAGGDRLHVSPIEVQPPSVQPSFAASGGSLTPPLLRALEQRAGPVVACGPGIVHASVEDGRLVTASARRDGQEAPDLARCVLTALDGLEASLLDGPSEVVVAIPREDSR